jgi:hypothetical protein
MPYGSCANSNISKINFQRTNTLTNYEFVDLFECVKIVVTCEG